MENTPYRAEELWLSEFFGYTDALHLTIEAEMDMQNCSAVLSDLLCVLKCPRVISYDRECDGCRVLIEGSNRDGEEFILGGVFSSEAMIVSITSVKKKRNPNDKDSATHLQED